MRLAVLATGDVHTSKWVNSLARAGHEVHLIVQEAAWERIETPVHVLPFRRPWGGLLNGWHLRRLLAKLKPDILHVHGASLDGLLGRLSGFHPSVVSLLGSDILVFPRLSLINRRILRANLRSYDWIGSTSRHMAQQVELYLPRATRVTVTPFGVETDVFAPRPEMKDPAFITVGTVKALHRTYGVDLLIRAFALARKELGARQSDFARKLRLLIVGDGPERQNLLALTRELSLDSVEFVPHVLNAKVPDLLNRMDIFAALSRSESFGVAVVEASSCGLPVVVSSVGGLPEVVSDGETGFIVRPEDPRAAAASLVRLIEDQALRRSMGEAGRERVRQEFEWSACVKRMEGLYASVLSSPRGRVAVS